MQKINGTELDKINSSVEVLKRDYSTAQVKEIARKQKQLVRPSESRMSNSKLNIYEKVPEEVCEKFIAAEVYSRERIEELCNEGK